MFCVLVFVKMLNKKEKGKKNQDITYQSNCLSSLHSEGHLPKNLFAAHKDTQGHTT